MSVDYSMPVLVVDDYKTVTRILHSLLKQAGFAEIDEASDGEEAIAKMRARKYGLVISDWHMAPVDGLELVKQARADEQLKHTPIILISAEAAPEYLNTARAAGAAAYVVKPFDAHTLRSRIEGALRTAA
jgi:two-component system chemotaxis response regulator CheY